MQKEKHVKSYTRKTKGGKVARVKAYSAKYDATDAIKQNMTRKKGAGDELKAKVAETTPYGFTLKEWDEWYNWDMVGDENNPAALKVQDALIAKMGKRAYNRYLRKCTDSYSEKGSRKEFKSFSEKFPHTESIEPKKETPQVSAPKKKETDTQRILRSPINSGTKPVPFITFRKENRRRNFFAKVILPSVLKLPVIGRSPTVEKLPVSILSDLMRVIETRNLWRLKNRPNLKLKVGNT